MKISFPVLFLALSLVLSAATATAEVISDPLPNPLRMRHGEPITSQQQWFHDRRPELKSMFQFYMYGTMPPTPRQPRFVVERVNKKFFDGKATKKEVTISFSSDTNAPQI